MAVGEFDSSAVVPVMRGKDSRSLDDEPDIELGWFRVCTPYSTYPSLLEVQ